jgi:cell division transport system ATP-binding protein
MSETEKIIDLKNVAIFQQENLILTNVNLEVSLGEFVYMIGKVGSGKTSLIKTLYAELTLNDGTAMVVDYNLSKLKAKDVPYLRRKIGIVFQDFQLLTDRSIYKNLLFVLKATNWKDKQHIENRIDEVLSKVNLTDKKHKMPNQLSGGEQQRVVIARALLNEPDLILADEPTGNLDPVTSAEIMQLLLDISKNGKAVVMATHNYSLIKKYPARTLKCENQMLIEIEDLNSLVVE